MAIVNYFIFNIRNGVWYSQVYTDNKELHGITQKGNGVRKREGMKKINLLVLSLFVMGCSITKNYYDKEPGAYCPPEKKTVEEVYFYKGVFVYRDRRDEYPMVGEVGWEKNEWNNIVGEDCTKECGKTMGGTTWKYIDDLIICACAEYNMSNITDKTDFNGN